MNKLYHQRYIGQIFHTLAFCLQKELRDCQSVLDIGCGPSSPLQHCKNINYSVGVEPYKPYFSQTETYKIHDKYINEKIENLSFPEKSFDAVILIEVLEHLPKKIGVKILKRAERWARKKVIVTTPNGFFLMDNNVDGNELQKHKCGWSVEEFKRRGYEVHGLAGHKFFYQRKNMVTSLAKNNDCYANLRFSPKSLFYIFNSIIQIVIYYFPRYSFELIAVKNV